MLFSLPHWLVLFISFLRISGSFFEEFESISDEEDNEIKPSSRVLKSHWKFTQTLNMSQDDVMLGCSSSTSLFPAGPAGLILQSRRRRPRVESSSVSAANVINRVRVSLTRGIWRSDLWGSDRFRNVVDVAPTGMFVEIIYDGKSSPQETPSEFDLRESMEDAEAALTFLSCESVSRSGGSSASSYGGMQGGWSGGASGVRREASYSRVCPSSFHAIDSTMVNTLSNKMICAEFPSTTLCVESIASFLSLLPCRGAAGVATMIQKNMNTFFTAPFLSLALELNVNETDDTLSLTQSFFSVQSYDPSLSSTKSMGYNDSFVECPATSSSSSDKSDKTHKKNQTHLHPYNLVIGRRASDIRLGVGSLLYSIRLKPSSDIKHLSDRINVSSVITFEIIETLPYMFLRTPNSLLAWASKEEEEVGEGKQSLRLPVDSVIFTYLDHGKERGAPEVVKITVTFSTSLTSFLSSTSAIFVSTRFSSTLLHSQEYPPDTHRGFDIPSAFVSMCIEHIDGCLVDVSQPLVVEIPSPDFSMPYNAATLVSTVMAFTLGTFVNALARRPRH